MTINACTSCVMLVYQMFQLLSPDKQCMWRYLDAKFHFFADKLAELIFAGIYWFLKFMSEDQKVLNLDLYEEMFQLALFVNQHDKYVVFIDDCQTSLIPWLCVSLRGISMLTEPLVKWYWRTFSRTLKICADGLRGTAHLCLWPPQIIVIEKHVVTSLFLSVFSGFCLSFSFLFPCLLTEWTSIRCT